MIELLIDVLIVLIHAAWLAEPASIHAAAAAVNALNHIAATGGLLNGDVIVR